MLSTPVTTLKIIAKIRFFFVGKRVVANMLYYAILDTGMSKIIEKPSRSHKVIGNGATLVVIHCNVPIFYRFRDISTHCSNIDLVVISRRSIHVELDSWPHTVIWCLRRCMCVMDSPALRTSVLYVLWNLWSHSLRGNTGLTSIRIFCRILLHHTWYNSPKMFTHWLCPRK